MGDTAPCCFKMISLVGGILLCSPSGLIWYWGNMSVYVFSYMRMAGVIETNILSPWLPSCYLVSWSLSLLTAQPISGVLGRKLTILLGICMIDAGLIASHFTVQHSVPLLYISHGVLSGLGRGCVYSMVMLYMIDITEKHIGVFSAAILTSANLGGAILNHLVSFYVNPKNESPDLQLGPALYFTQRAIVSEVPRVYLLLGAVSAALHLTGLFLLLVTIQSSYKHEKSQDSEHGDKLPLTSGKKYLTETKGSHSAIDDRTLNGDTGRNDSACNNASRLTQNKSESDGNAIDSKEYLEKEHDIVSYTPSEVLRDKRLYALCAMLMIADMGFVIHNSCYKKFGQLFIDNDHSFGVLGTAMTMSVAFMRLSSGMLFDMADLKSAVMVFSSALSVTFAFLYVTPVIHPWLYFLFAVLVACLDGGYFSSFTIITLRLFGPKHFSTNYGLVMTSTVFINLASPLLIEVLIQRWGWFSIFLSLGCLNCVGLVIIILTLPKHL